MDIKKLKGIVSIAGKSFGNFSNDRGTKLSASLSYYTVFSLPSLLFLLIGLGGLVFGKQAIQGQLFNQITAFVGPSAAKDIQDMLAHTNISKTSIWATIIGGALLWFTAAGVFAEIQDSLDFIWGLKSKAKKGLMMMLMNRLMSFSMIIVLGFILLVSLVLNALLAAFLGKLKSWFPDSIVNLFFIVNYAVILVVIICLFSFLFKLLPDAKLKFKDVLPGAIFTSALFVIGKFAIGFYLNHFGNTKVYGAAGSLILIILWVYYNAIILYLGAEFTKAYMLEKGKEITPMPYAEFVDDKMNKQVQEGEKAKAPANQAK